MAAGHLQCGLTDRGQITANHRLVYERDVGEVIAHLRDTVDC